MKKILSNLKVILEMKHLIYLQREKKRAIKNDWEFLGNTDLTDGRMFLFG